MNNFVDRKKVKVILPRNLTKGNRHLFYPAEFDIYATKVMTVRNAIVTANGLCFKDRKLISGSVQAYPEKLLIFEKSGALALQRSSYHQLNSSDQHLVVHHPWSGNYYHWITEAIPRIWKVKKELSSLTLVLPANLLALDFVRESLKCFAFKNIEVVPPNCNIIIPNAVIPEIKPFCYSYESQTMQEIACHFRVFAQSVGYSETNRKKLVYICRGKSLRREIANEEEVIRKLEEFDIATIDARLVSFWDQVSLSSNLKLLISNGSGLTNMIFMKRKSAVLELHKRITNINDFHDKVLWHLASVLKLKFYHQICEPLDPGKDMYKANLIVDTNLLQRNIQKCLKDIS